MPDVKIRFARWHVVTRAGQKKLLTDWERDARGVPVLYAEAIGHAVARAISRREKTGAQVIGEGGEELGRYVWLPRTKEVVARPVEPEG